jgi:hypothetical protein
LEQSLADLDPILVRYILRDAALVAAVDGAYDNKELRALRKIAKAGGITTNQLSDLLDWVANGWLWYAEAEKIYDDSVGKP